MAEQTTDAGELDATDLFHPTLRTYQRLYHLLINDGVTVERALCLPEGAAERGFLPRFGGAEQLGQLEDYFVRENEAGMIWGASQRAQGCGEGGSSEGKRDEGVVVVEAGTRRQEVEAVAAV